SRLHPTEPYESFANRIQPRPPRSHHLGQSVLGRAELPAHYQGLGLPLRGAGLERGAGRDPPEGFDGRIVSAGSPLAHAEPVVDPAPPGEEPPMGERPEPLSCRSPFTPGDLLPCPNEFAAGPPKPQEDSAHSEDRQQEDRGQCSGPW